MRNRAGTIAVSPSETDKIECSNVTEQKEQGDVIPDLGRSLEKVFPDPFLSQTKLRPAGKVSSMGKRK